jgi:hypothetical protein
MAKFSFKRPRIISKKFPRVDSSIDSVTKSLNDLVFSYTEQVDKSLQKKHVMMAISSLVLILVFGSFISPKGKAESSIFYPDTCLGGWINPQYAQGEQETTSNGDESQFTKKNSAILPKNTNAEMYCGNFKGAFIKDTRPTKIIVSLALTKGADLLLEDTIESGSFASSSLQILDTASTTDVSFTLTEGSSTSATTTAVTASSTSDGSSTASTTEQSSGSTTVESSTSSVVSPSSPEVVTASPDGQNVTSSIVNGIIESLKDTVKTLFSSDATDSAKTDTVVVPPPAPEPAPVETPDPSPTPAPETTPAPTSLLKPLQDSFIALFFQKVWAETADGGTTTDTVVTENPIDFGTAASTSMIIDASSTRSSSTLESVTDTSSSTLTEATTSDVSVASSTGDTNQFQNNFLEVMYTFDGVTWVSLGELNEISMKYRNFEIPVTATTSWNDMNRLQVKIISKKQVDETPTVYLDAIKVDVLYEVVIPRPHPDFGRDIILNDKSSDGARVVNIVNSDTGASQIWYTTVDSQGDYGIAPGTWVQVNLDDTNFSAKLIDMYGQNIFWIDESQKMLWVTNLQKETNNGIGLTVGTSTTIAFIKANDEEWVFEYNNASGTSTLYPKK